MNAAVARCLNQPAVWAALVRGDPENRPLALTALSAAAFHLYGALSPAWA